MPKGTNTFCSSERGALVLRLNDGTRENGCRPAADVLFGSAASVLGARCLGVVLTGMGHDGTAGARELHAEGACFVAQDQASSVVRGMPGPLVEAGIANVILHLSAIGPWVTERVRAANRAYARRV